MYRLWGLSWVSLSKWWLPLPDWFSIHWQYVDCAAQSVSLCLVQLSYQCWNLCLLQYYQVSYKVYSQGTRSGSYRAISRQWGDEVFGCQIYKLTYKIVHMFSTFGKMSLLSKYLHSHSCSEYSRLQICILAFIQVTIQVYSFSFDEVTFKSLRLLHLNNFVTSILKHKISSSNLIYGLICLINSVCVSMATLWYVWCVFGAFYLMLL
jgi:hypothetical protein